jgi:hypothetical protein
LRSVCLSHRLWFLLFILFFFLYYISLWRLVINAIQPLNKDRKCYRLVGGVLVERTVGEVLPAVQKNRDNVTQTLCFGFFCTHTLAHSLTHSPTHSLWITQYKNEV